MSAYASHKTLILFRISDGRKKKIVPKQVLEDFNYLWSQQYAQIEVGFNFEGFFFLTGTKGKFSIVLSSVRLEMKQISWKQKLF